VRGEDVVTLGKLELKYHASYWHVKY